MLPEEYIIDHDNEPNGYDKCVCYFDGCLCKQVHYDLLYLYYMQDGAEDLLAKEGAD